jgi:hypothetical protein
MVGKSPIAATDDEKAALRVMAGLRIGPKPP